MYEITMLLLTVTLLIYSYRNYQVILIYFHASGFLRDALKKHLSCIRKSKHPAKVLCRDKDEGVLMDERAMIEKWK